MRAEGQQSRIVWNVFGPGLLTGLVALSAILGGCAAMDTGQLRGGSGPVAWEVTNIGQLISLDQRRILWTYAIVLKETAGSTIQFERVERGTSAPGAELHNALFATEAFERRLDPHSELALPYADAVGWLPGVSVPFGGTAGLAPIIVERRFIGKDDRGAAVTVPVRLLLDRSVGKLSKPPGTPGPLPPVRRLTPDELRVLAGTWRGHYRTGEFDIPLEVVVREDGSFEAGENDPVTNRFGGRLRIEGGKIVYDQGPDTGTLTLHESGGRRVMAGNVSGMRSGQTVTYSIRLRSDSP